jgi:acyl-CoA thioesterase YciA
MSNDHFDDDDLPQKPQGTLALQTIAMPSDTNPRGEVFAGWLLSQMDLAASITALKIARGRVATVSVSGMTFLSPVHVGAVVSCYTDVVDIGRSSMRIYVEVWISHKQTFEPVKVTEGEFVFVALDDNGKTRRLPDAG